VRLLPLLCLGLTLLGCKKKVEEPVAADPPSTEVSTEVEATTDAPSQEGETDIEEAVQVPELETVEHGLVLQSRLDEATALLTRGDVSGAQSALVILEELAVQNADIAIIQYNMGVAHLLMDDRQEARKAFLRATVVDASLSAAWLNLATMSEQSGDLRSALAKIDAGLSSSPESTQVRLDSGPSWSAGDRDLLVARIHLLRMTGSYEMAIDQAKLAIQEDGHNLAAYDALGMAYLEQADASPSIADAARERARFIYQLANQFVSGAENSTSIHTNLGRLYLAKDWKYDAIIEFEKAIELDPNSVQAYLYLAEIDLDNRQFAAARNRLEIARDLAPHEPGIWISLGIAYRGLNQPDDALAAYEKAISLDPDNLEPNLNIAVVMADQQFEYEDALALLEQYREDGGLNSDLAQKWEEQIKEQQKRRDKAERKRQRAEDRKKQRTEEDRLRLEEEERVRLEEEASQAEEAERLRLEEEEAALQVETTEETDTESSETAEQPVGETEGTDQTGETENAEESTGTGGAPPVEEPEVEDPVPESPPDSADPIPEPTAVEIPVETGAEETEPATVPEEDVPSDAQVPEVDSETEESPWGGTESDSGGGTASSELAGSSCDAIGACGSEALECASDGVCRDSGSISTLGMGCLEEFDCAFGLGCVAQVCAESTQEDETPSVTPGSNPWGGAQ
jgi:tetratricopeptide (TPR) repeat protein